MLAALLLAAAAIIPAQYLEFDQSIESLFAKDNPRLIDFLYSKRHFGGDELVIIAYRDPELLTPAGLERNRQFADSFKNVPGVMPHSRQCLATNLSLEQLTLPSQLQWIKARIRQHVEPQLKGLVRGILLGDDDQTTAIVLRLKPRTRRSRTGAILDETAPPPKAAASAKSDKPSDKPTDKPAPDRQATDRQAPDRQATDRRATVGQSENDPAGAARVPSPDPNPGSTDTTDDITPRRVTVAEIRKVAARFPYPTYIVGEAVQLSDMFLYVEQDGAVLGLASSLLLMFVILVLFRSWRWVLLPLLVVHVTLVWTRASLVLSRLQLSMVSSMLNSLVTIIAVATVIHVTVTFRELRSHLGREDALRGTFQRLLAPIVWTCFTTAAGFASQMISHIHPVQSFGLMMSLASLLVLAAIVSLLPGGILFGSVESNPGKALAHDRLQHWLYTITLWVERHPNRVLFGSAVVAVATLLGLQRLRVETDFSRNFRESSPIVQSLNFVESNLGGAGTWEVIVPVPSEWSSEDMLRTADFAARLRELTIDGEKGLTKVTALSDGVNLIPSIPFVSRTVEQKLKLLDRVQPELIPALYNRDAGVQRLLLRARERQPAETRLKLIAEVERIGSEIYPDARIRCTGMFVIVTFLIDSLLGDQWISFALAAASIFVMMSIAFRSVVLGAISLVPNLTPIVMVIGVMGLVGLPLDIGTAMIASVSMGLTIDSSIHYLTGFQRALRAGHPFYAALRETHAGVGSALVYATSALMIGFLVLTLSNFIPLVHFGILVSVAMFGGLMGNLVLLPLLLRFVHGGEIVPRGTSAGHPGRPDRRVN
jgi:predicted RND superfamily exporter protein